jgi:type IV pilus assembly protein PilB
MADNAVPWLINIARRATLPGVEALRPDASTALTASWEAVERACGVSGDELVLYVANAFRLKPADFRTSQTRALKLIPEKLVRAHQILPLREEDKVLVVATSDPTNPDVEQAVAFASGRRAEFEVAAPETLRLAIESRFSPEQMIDALLGAIDTSGVELVSITGETSTANDPDASRIRRLINLILQEAVRQSATHVHIEPGGAGAVVRFRVDGSLRNPALQLPMLALSKIVSRIQGIAHIGATRFDSKEGRARAKVGGVTYDLRVSVAMGREGDRAVLRIIDPQAALLLQDISLPSAELVRFRTLLANTEGLIVISAPRGSGATTTAYAALRDLAGEGRGVITLEDPVEYDLTGVTQVAVDFARRSTVIEGLTQAAGGEFKVVFISDVRDADTAHVMVETAAAGKLVIALMHTADAAAVVERLEALGINRDRIAKVLRGVVAQRLLRRSCPHCGIEPDSILSAEDTRLRERYNVAEKMRGAGCVSCGKSGYKGRLPVTEVLLMTPALSGKIVGGAASEDIALAAMTEGMRPLLDSARERVRVGETTLDELDRVLGDPMEPRATRTKPHVLVVDDDAVSRTYVRELLEAAGYAVSEANDGVTGLEYIESAEDLALVVLDVEMPHMGGREVLAKVRRSVATHAIPVVVLTGLEGQLTEAQVMELGADDYLHKPIDAARFGERISAALARAGG